MAKIHEKYTSKGIVGRPRKTGAVALEHQVKSAVAKSKLILCGEIDQASQEARNRAQRKKA